MIRKCGVLRVFQGVGGPGAEEPDLGFQPYVELVPYCGAGKGNQVADFLGGSSAVVHDKVCVFAGDLSIAEAVSF